MSLIESLFADAHLSYPVPGCGMSRDCFGRNRKEVLAAAKRHGYRISGASKTDPEALRHMSASVHFCK